MASINFNYASVTAQRNLGATQGAFHKAVQRLSSGLRINSGADDAAGLFISEKLKSQIKGLQQASRNTQDGISLIQTAEGALNVMHSLLERMRELAVQSANGVYGTDERNAISTEVQALKDEIDRVRDTTSFNGLKLLDGTMGSQPTVTTPLPPAITGAGIVSIVATDPDVQTGATWDITTTNIVAGPPGSVDIKIDAPNGSTQTITGVAVPTSGVTTVNFDALGLTVQIDSTAGAALAITDAAFTVAPDLTPSLSLQVGANNTTADQITISSVVDMAANTLGVGKTVAASGNIGAGLASVGTDVQTQGTSGAGATGSYKAIDDIDAAILQVSETRADLGAMQTRLEFTVTNLAVSAENQAAANSRVRDADVAMEVSNMVKTQILSQSAMAVLAQSNAAPQALLSLLR